MQNSETALNKRLDLDETERDDSDSNCSDSSPDDGKAFKPTNSKSKDPSGSGNNISYPTPNISVGPPIHPPPHLLPYLYPHGFYPPSPISLLHNPSTAATLNPSLNSSLFFNAQLALASQHSSLFGHYPCHSPSSPIQGMKGNRFSPYNLPSGLGSAFEAVAPSTGQRSLSSSPHMYPNTTLTNSPNREASISPSLSQTQSQLQLKTSSERDTNLSVKSTNALSNSPSELKNIENMVNCLDTQEINRNSTDESIEQESLE